MFSKKITNNFKQILNALSNHKDIKHITQVNTQLKQFNNIRWTQRIHRLNWRKLDLHQRRQYFGWHIDHSYHYHQTSVETERNKHVFQGWDPLGNT